MAGFRVALDAEESAGAHLGQVRDQLAEIGLAEDLALVALGVFSRKRHPRAFADTLLVVGAVLQPAQLGGRGELLVVAVGDPRIGHRGLKPLRVRPRVLGTANATALADVEKHGDAGIPERRQEGLGAEAVDADRVDPPGDRPTVPCRRVGTDEIRPQVYEDERPAEELSPFHAWARANDPGWTYTLVRVVLTPIVLLLYRTRAIDRTNVPAAGPVILAPNHFSNMDHFFCGVWLRRRIRFMTKSQIFGRPGPGGKALSYLFRNAGHFPVRRGHNDVEAFVTAHSILERGGCVGIYAEGGRSRSGGLGEPRPGLGRLALESGAPVVPVAIHGSKDVRGWRRGRFPQVRVAFGEPIALEQVPEPSREQQIEAAAQLFARVRTLYEQLERG